MLEPQKFHALGAAAIAVTTAASPQLVPPRSLSCSRLVSRGGTRIVLPSSNPVRRCFQLLPHPQFLTLAAANLPEYRGCSLLILTLAAFGCFRRVSRSSCQADLGIRQARSNTISSRSPMDRLRQEKILKFEEFVDQRLKPDLVRAIAERDKVFEQQKIFSDLRRNIENLEKNSVTSLKTLVNIGSEVYLQAEVPDTQHIFVDIGLGFHVEFTWSEALNYITQREERIKRQLEEYTQLIASIKAQIKLVCEGIMELLQLPAEKPLPERTF